MVQTVEAQEMVGGVQAWRVTTLQINTEGTPSARIQSSYSQVTPTEVRFVGHRPDVFEAQGVTRYVASQAAALPRTMLMGEVYESSWVTFRDERNNQAIGQVKETVAYAGRQSATVTAGSFPGCDLLDSMIQFDGGEPNDVERRFLDPSAGMVKYVHLDLTDEWAGQRHDYDAEWVRAGAQTWGNAPAFDFASCFPLQVGNKWKIGTPGSYTEIGQVGAPGSLGGYSNVFPVAWHDFGGSRPQQWTDHWADKAGSRYFVGITPDPDEYPHTALLVEPPRLPLSCPLGFAERRDSSIVDAVNGSKLGTMHHFMMPVAAGLSVNTPAGRFDNCFLLFTITTNVVPSMDVFGYWYDFEYRAPGIGMVDYWTINEQNPPGNWDHAGSLLGAFINGTWYGEHF